MNIFNVRICIQENKINSSFFFLAFPTGISNEFFVNESAEKSGYKYPDVKNFSRHS